MRDHIERSRKRFMRFFTDIKGDGAADAAGSTVEVMRR
ncbi:hypothetical protein BHMPCIPO_06300 [Ensifer sesbaniae]|nr:hypothetical protein [Ensifer sesbaniae]